MIRVVFAGTPEFAVPCLQALFDADEMPVVGVFTQPDRPAGRGRALTASPVKCCAQQHDVPIFQPEHWKEPETVATLAALEADVMVVVAYGLLLPQIVLDTPRCGCVNVHASLLPRWRGAAPIQHAMLAGDAETGVCLMHMVLGLDAGDVFARKTCAITQNDTAQDLQQRLAQMGAELISAHLPAYVAGQMELTPQDEAHVTYAAKLSKAQGQLDWQRPATELARQVQALNPWPVAYFRSGDEPIRVWQASVDTPSVDATSAAPGQILAVTPQGLQVACGEGVLLLEELQWPGKRRAPAAQVAQNRAALGVGQVLY